MRKILSLFCAAGLLAGCATGHKFSLDRASQVRVGMTTNELVQVMGREPFTKAPVKVDFDGRVPTTGRGYFEASSVWGAPAGLERWIWFYDSGVKKEVASFVVADGKVLQVPGSIARSKAEQEHQSAQAVEELNALISEQRAADLAAKNKADEEKKAEFVRSHQELSEQIRESVLAGQVCIGMPAEALELSWGRPRHKQKTTGRFGTSETWSYGDQFGGPSVFLDNGKVSGWHTSE
jgi:hypothetical protein